MNKIEIINSTNLKISVFAHCSNYIIIFMYSILV